MSESGYYPPYIKHPDWIDPGASILGADGTALSVVSYVARALKKAGNSPEVVNTFRTQAMADDYDHLLRVSMDYAGMMDSDDPFDEED